MTTLELVQTGLALAGVAGIGGIWFKLGALTGALDAVNAVTDSLRDRVQRLENQYLFGKE